MKRFLGTLLFSVVIGCAQEHSPAPATPSGDSTGHAQAPIESSASAGQAHAQAAAKHGEGHEEAPMPNEIWWKWANFAVLAGLLGWLIGKNAGPFFRARTEEIQKGIRDAAQVRAEAEARAAEIEKRVANLATEVEALRSKSKQEISTEAARVQAETQAQLEKIQARAESQIASAAKQASLQLKAYSAQLALELAEKQIKQNLDTPTQNDLTAAFISDLHAQSSAAPGGVQ